MFYTRPVYVLVFNDIIASECNECRRYLRRLRLVLCHYVWFTVYCSCTSATDWSLSAVLHPRSRHWLIGCMTLPRAMQCNADRQSGTFSQLLHSPVANSISFPPAIDYNWRNKPSVRIYCPPGYIRSPQAFLFTWNTLEYRRLFCSRVQTSIMPHKEHLFTLPLHLWRNYYAASNAKRVSCGPIATDDPAEWCVNRSVCHVAVLYKKRLNGSRSCLGWRFLGTQGTLY